jgi:hypothetical protein
LNGAPDFARDDQAEPRAMERICLRSDKEREVSRRNATAQSLGSHELGVPAKPAVAREVWHHYFL